MKKFFIPLIIFLILFEGISIIFTKFELFVFNEKPKYSFEEEFLHDWIEKDEDGISWHKKNYKTRHISRCFDVEYETNNVGARDYNDYFIDDLNYSIMLIGDSFAEGPGVDIDKIFSKLIEKKIGKQVLNFGNSGTEPKTQLTRYIKFGEKFNFDELVYFFLPQNDYSTPKNNQKKITNSDITKNDKNFLSNINLGKIKYKIVNYIARYTYSYNFIRSAVFILDINLNYGYENLSYFYKNKKNIDYTFKYLENLISYKSVNSYIIIIPTIYDINHFQKKNINYKNLYWYKKIVAISKRNNSTLIDLMDFINFKEKPFYFHSCDGHWSEYGNNFAAQVFLDHYKKKN